MLLLYAGCWGDLGAGGRMRQLAPALLAGCLALTLSFAGTCAYSTTSLISHHTKPVSREGFPAVYDPTATDVPCSTVNCPHVEEEAPIRGYGSILRRFPSERWVSTGSDTWTWKHLAAMDFKEGFLVGDCASGPGWA